VSLNIKNEETVRLVRELADELGVSMTAAITDAVQARLASVRRDAPQGDFDVEDMLALAREIRARIGDADLNREIDDLYDDETGLPK
jgi:hypothetical protein